MDPDATLDRVEDALLAGDLSEALDALTDYTVWREGGGFPSEDGDEQAERASRLIVVLLESELRNLKKQP